MENGNNNSVSRRNFIGTTALVAAGLAFTPRVFASVKGKPDSKFGGVQIGAITYSWRSMPSTAEDILKYCVEAGISSIELMGDVAEHYAGLPAGAPRPQRGVELTDAEKAEFQKKADAANKAQRDWRLSVSMDKYKALRQMYNKAGVNIHIVKFAPANWSDEEIDYAFKAAKVLGAGGITNEIGEEACKRLGKFAEKHNMFAIFHNHGQPGEAGFSFDKFLAYSPKNMLNFDAGHYFGATGIHPNELIERLHDRIFSIHTKDKTGKNGTPPNTNMPWGKGDTPIADMLKLVQKNKWPIVFDIELEYDVPENSDAQKEVIKCVEYCKKILV
jgi:sugar phosphate isomerase/epimerase